MKNVTITVEDDVLEWARIEAAKRNSSVSRMLGDYMAEMRKRADAYEHAYQSWLASTQTPLPAWASDGVRYPTREETYDRAAQRSDYAKHHAQAQP